MRLLLWWAPPLSPPSPPSLPLMSSLIVFVAGNDAGIDYGVISRSRVLTRKRRARFEKLPSRREGVDSCNLNGA